MEKETVFDYEVAFVGDDMSTRITITEDRDDIDHNIIIARATKMICDMWAVKDIPQEYTIVDVTVQEIEIN